MAHSALLNLQLLVNTFIHHKKMFLYPMCNARELTQEDRKNIF